MPPRTIEQVIGSELKRLREQAGVRQEVVALVAQRLDLDWGQPTVSAIEAGRRDLSVSELVLLPSILRAAGLSTTALQLRDLIPNTNEPLRLAGATCAMARALLRPRAAAEDKGKPPATLAPAAGRAGTSEADRKAARKLHTEPAAIVTAAQKLWGRGLADERDARIGDALTTLSPRSLQGLRGRVTLALVRELRPVLKTLRRSRHG